MNKIKRFIIGGKFYNKKRMIVVSFLALYFAIMGFFCLNWLVFLGLFLALEYMECIKPTISDYRYWIIRRKYRANLKAIKAVDDGYFKNVDAKTIVELAKKSIRMTTDNIEIRHKIEELEQQNDFECGCVTEYKDKCKTLLDMVLQNKPELTDWAELNFKEFMVDEIN